MQRVPLGAADSPHAVRRGGRSGRPSGGQRLPLALAAVGVAAAVGGLVLYATPADFVVRVDAGGYHLAGEDLVSRGGGVFLSASGTALVVERRPERVLAAGSAELNGQPASGRCEEAAGSGQATCEFTVAGRSFTAADVRTATGWSRRYSDGETISIRVDGDGDTPVPFPLGR
ncbi:MAG TPA: hypothetical protein VKF59_13955 [Candidatus Dormibacteraeota bacterium]|nr:hypothetical protein [Candidatus Dormibacteraeota bacterium]